MNQPQRPVGLGHVAAIERWSRFIGTRMRSPPSESGRERSIKISDMSEIKIAQPFDSAANWAASLRMRWGDQRYSPVSAKAETSSNAPDVLPFRNAGDYGRR